MSYDPFFQRMVGGLRLGLIKYFALGCTTLCTLRDVGTLIILTHLHTSSLGNANLTAGRPKELRVCNDDDGEYGFDDAGERGEPGGAPGVFSPKSSVSRRSFSATLERDLESCSGESISGKPCIFRFAASTLCSARRRAAFRILAAPLSPTASSVSAKLPAVISADGVDFTLAFMAAFWNNLALVADCCHNLRVPWMVRFGTAGSSNSSSASSARVRVRVRVRVGARVRARFRIRVRVRVSGQG